MKGRKPEPDATADIDWLAVDMVVVEGRRMSLTAEERRAAVRRLRHRIINRLDNTADLPPGKITVQEAAERMGTTDRTIHRTLASLPPASEQLCPFCGEQMWVRDDGTVEQHPTATFEKCRGGAAPLHGLASIRPDLYGWAAS